MSNTMPGTALQARGLRPIGELAADRPHGVRLRYMAGCRCAECRKANSAYECARQKARRGGDWNGLVPADKARAHILKLSKSHVGRRAIAEATDVAMTVIVEIRSGKKKRIRARTERLILGVGRAQALDRALVRAAPTWRLIGELIEEGYTVPFLAERLGYKTPVLQLKKTRVTVRNAARVEKLHRELTA